MFGSVDLGTDEYFDHCVWLRVAATAFFYSSAVEGAVALLQSTRTASVAQLARSEILHGSAAPRTIYTGDKARAGVLCFGCLVSYDR